MSEFLFDPNISESYFWSFRDINSVVRDARTNFGRRRLCRHNVPVYAELKECVVKVVNKSESENYSRDSSVLCILFRSSMNFYNSLPRLLEICNCFRFVCIVIGEEDCMISFFFFCSATNLASAIENWSRAWSTCDSRVCVAPCVCHTFFVWHAFLCVTHSSVCVTHLLWWNIT